MGEPELRAQILEKLGYTESATIEEMQGFRGGLNEGIWFLSEPGSPAQDVVLKLVKGQSYDPLIATEAENFVALHGKHPGIRKDEGLAFPFKILGCLGPDGTKRYDLIVMKKARGERFSDIICYKWYGQQVDLLLQIFEEVGTSLRDFHARHNNIQHGDFQPMNIFYDEAASRICLIDLGGMGVPTLTDDTDHFKNSVRLTCSLYSAQLATDGVERFETGYAKGSS